MLSVSALRRVLRHGTLVGSSPTREIAVARPAGSTMRRENMPPSARKAEVDMFAKTIVEPKVAHCGHQTSFSLVKHLLNGFQQILERCSERAQAAGDGRGRPTCSSRSVERLGRG